MFIIALFIIATCGIYTIVKCSSTIKKNEIMSFIGRQVELEIIVLSEISQTLERHVFSHMWNFRRKEQGTVKDTEGDKGKGDKRG
jgi:hypothetical protein